MDVNKLTINWCEYSDLPGAWDYAINKEDNTMILKNDLIVFDELYFTENDIDRIIEMAWEDRTSFDAIKLQFGLNNSQVIKFMRKFSKISSFKMWRKRTTGRNTKHEIKRDIMLTFKSNMQRNTGNKISKR